MNAFVSALEPTLVAVLSVIVGMILLAVMLLPRRDGPPSDKEPMMRNAYRRTRKKRRSMKNHRSAFMLPRSVRHRIAGNRRGSGAGREQGRATAEGKGAPGSHYSASAIEGRAARGRAYLEAHYGLIWIRSNIPAI